MRRCLALGGCILLGGCGLRVSSPDLFQLTRNGQGKPLTVIVNDGGTIRCDRGAAKPISDALLLQARSLATRLDNDAKAKLRLPPASGSVFSYSIRFQDGQVSFADTATASHPELAEAELFALRVARGPCGRAG